MPRALTEKEKRSALWHRLHAFIRNEMASITTAPNIWPARLECRVGSDLPETLKSKGWLVSDGGQAEVFLPVSEQVKQAGGVTSVTIQSLQPTTINVFLVTYP
jgi:hypothetical protein